MNLAAYLSSYLSWRHARQVCARRQPEIASHLARLLRHQPPGALDRLIDGGADQVLEQFAVVELHALIADGATEHFHSAIDPSLDHAGAGVALRGDLAQRLLETLDALLDLGQLLHQRRDLSQFLEHVGYTSS